MKTKDLSRLTACLICLSLGIIASACSVPGFVFRAPLPDPVISSVTPPGASGDAHFIQADEYFVFNESLGNNTWNQVWIGKMLNPPTAENRNMANFLLVQLNAQELCRYWIRTRIATESDLVRNKEVIFCDNRGPGDIFLPPSSNQQARSLDWVQSRITDLSTISQGYITCGHGYKVSLGNLRVMQ